MRRQKLQTAERGKEPPKPLTWVYGKVEPGWYCARDGWNEWYSDHLRELGYEVRKSYLMPTEAFSYAEQVPR